MLSAERKNKLAAAVILVIDAERRRQHETKKRRFWVDEVFLNREESNFF